MKPNQRIEADALQPRVLHRSLCSVQNARLQSAAHPRRWVAENKISE